MKYYAFTITDAEELGRHIMTDSQLFFVKTPLARLSSDDIYDTMGRLARELQIKNNIVEYNMRYDWSEVLEAYQDGKVSVPSPAFFPLHPTDMMMVRDICKLIIVSNEDRLPLKNTI